MPIAGIVTLVGVALTVGALAYFLGHVILLLRGTHFDLGTIVAGLRAIGHQAEPLAEVVGEIRSDLEEVQEVYDALLVAKLGDDALFESGPPHRLATPPSRGPGRRQHHTDARP